MKIPLLLLLAMHTMASAQPRIEVSDINFFTLGVGVSTTKLLRICNTGTGTLEFVEGPGGDFVEWIKKPQFNVSQAEMEKLRTTQLQPDSCINIMVTFMSLTTGEFRDSAQLFANTRNRKDWSIWTATVRQPGPKLTPYDWGPRWVVTPLAECTKNTITGYIDTVIISNTGDSPYLVEGLSIVGTDAPWFRLTGTATAGTAVEPGMLIRPEAELASYRQVVIFTPEHERDYEVRLEMATYDPTTNRRDTIYSTLKGRGIETHVVVSDLAFGSVDPAGNPSIPGSVTITAPPTRDLTITALTIVGPMAANFDFDFTVGPTTANPWVIRSGTTREVPLRFRPIMSGNTMAELFITGDHERCSSDSVALLTGHMTSGVASDERIEGNQLLRVESGSLRVRLVRGGVVHLEIFNALGERVLSVSEEREAGEQTIAFDAVLGFVRVSVGSWSATAVMR